MRFLGCFSRCVNAPDCGACREIARKYQYDAKSSSTDFMIGAILILSELQKIFLIEFFAIGNKIENLGRDVHHIRSGS
jgi:hypothetical protein